jgi:hypothetical protein
MGCLTMVKSCLSICVLVVWASLVVTFMEGGVNSKESQRHHYVTRRPLADVAGVSTRLII